MGDFSQHHILVQWGGKLPGNESWSCSLRVGDVPDPITGIALIPPLGEVADWMNGSLKDAVLAYHTRVSTGINPHALLTFVKANRIETTGHYLDSGTNQYLFADIPGTGNGSFNLPNQNTLCISLTTGYSRGPAHRGRFYLPIPAFTTDPVTGGIDPSYATAVRNSTKTFIEAVADWPGIDVPGSPTPIVMSRGRGATATLPARAGSVRMITGCAVGTVIDTQRRRRKALKENYQSVNLDLGTF